MKMFNGPISIEFVKARAIIAFAVIVLLMLFPREMVFKRAY